MTVTVLLYKLVSQDRFISFWWNKKGRTHGNQQFYNFRLHCRHQPILYCTHSTRHKSTFDCWSHLTYIFFPKHIHFFTYNRNHHISRIYKCNKKRDITVCFITANCVFKGGGWGCGGIVSTTFLKLNHNEVDDNYTQWSSW